MSTIFTVFFLIIFYTRAQCLVGRTLIWDKVRQNFVGLPNISQFVDFQQQAMVKDRFPAVNDISGKVLRVSYYETKDLVMFYANSTKITGINGEIWNLLAEILNITLIPMQYKGQFGVKLENGSYSDLLGLIERNEIDVIMRTGYYITHVDVLDYTMPIWQTDFQLYIKPSYMYDKKWITTMFSSRSWSVIIFLCFILSMAGYVFQKEYYQISKRKKRVKKRGEHFDFNDHLFYTYSTMCNQGYLPDAFQDQNRILSLSKTIFAWLILLTFSSNLIYRMTNRTVIPPFNDVHTLLNETTYDILAFKGTSIYENLKETIDGTSKKHQIRFHFVDEPSTMYQRTCQEENLYAMIETQDKVKVRQKDFCPLIPMGNSFFRTWIGFGTPKHFRYNKVINLSILKLYESGLLDALKDRWLEYRNVNIENSSFHAIDWQQIYLIFYIHFIGIVFSLVILLMEKIIFLCNSRQK